jgi:folylpolyglutamate synthase
VVCCHGIWLGGASNGHDESEWLIEDYKKGETPTFIAHIKDGVKALSEDAKAVLVFSGYVLLFLYFSIWSLYT